MFQDKRFAPILCMALSYISISLGAASTVINPEGHKAPLLWLLCYYGTMLGMGLVLFFAAQSRTPRPIPTAPVKTISALLRPLPLLFLVPALCVAVPLVIPSTGETMRTVGAWIPAATLGLCLPGAVLIFFRSVPPEQQGVTLGLCIACGEVVWSALLPFLSLLDPAMPPQEQTSHLHAFQSVVQVGIGICLALSFAGILPTGSGLTDQPRTPGNCDALCDRNSGDAHLPVKPFVLLLLAAALFSMLFGLGFGMAFPKSMPGQGFADRPHFLLILLPPLAGYLLDKGGRAAILPALLWAVSALAVPLLAAPGEFSALLGMLLESGRGVALLGVLLFLARMTRDRAILPLCILPVQLLYMFQPAGAALTRLPYGQNLAAWLLAVAFIVIGTAALRLIRTATTTWREEMIHPALPVKLAEPDGSTGPDAPDHEAEARETSRLAAFAMTFDLTRRETEILAHLRKNNDLHVVALALGVSTNTVKFHVQGLLRKTVMRNRQKLLHFYEAWSGSGQENNPA